MPAHENNWLCFVAASVWQNQMKLQIVSESSHHEGILDIKGNGGLDVSCFGNVAGNPYIWGVQSQGKLDGKNAASIVPTFTGQYSHSGGVCGDFTIGQQQDRSWMTIGVLGAPKTISLMPLDDFHIPCAIDVLGIPGVTMRLETGLIPWSPPTLPLDTIKKFGKPKHYAGYFTSLALPKQSLPPATATITAILIANELILSRFYNKWPDAS